MKIIEFCSKTLVIILSTCVSACNFYRDAGQTTAMAKQFEEEGRMIAAEKKAIRENAKNADTNDGVSKEEAEALVKNYLLEKHPQWMGWTVVVNDDGKRWKTTSSFVSDEEVIYIDKETAELTDSAFGIGFTHIPKK